MFYYRSPFNTQVETVPLNNLENYIFISFAQCSDIYRADSYRDEVMLSQR